MSSGLSIAPPSVEGLFSITLKRRNSARFFPLYFIWGG